MIEFVIVALLLFTLLFGIMEFGFMMSGSLTVNAAAHQGARAAALGKDSAAAVNTAMAGLRGPKTVTTAYYDGAWHNTTSLPRNLTNDNQVRVKIDYTYQTLTFVGAALPGTRNGKRTLSGQAVMRYGG